MVAHRHRKWLEEFRRNGCVICGTTEHLTAHHVDKRRKKFDIGNAHYSIGVKTFRAELAKCICVCRECHDLLESVVDSEGFDN